MLTHIRQVGRIGARLLSFPSKLHYSRDNNIAIPDSYNLHSTTSAALQLHSTTAHGVLTVMYYHRWYALLLCIYYYGTYYSLYPLISCYLIAYSLRRKKKNLSSRCFIGSLENKKIFCQQVCTRGTFKFLGQGWQVVNIYKVVYTGESFHLEVASCACWLLRWNLSRWQNLLRCRNLLRYLTTDIDKLNS